MANDLRVGVLCSAGPVVGGNLPPGVVAHVSTQGWQEPWRNPALPRPPLLAGGPERPPAVVISRSGRSGTTFGRDHDVLTPGSTSCSASPPPHDPQGAADRRKKQGRPVTQGPTGHGIAVPEGGGDRDGEAIDGVPPASKASDRSWEGAFWEVDLKEHQVQVEGYALKHGRGDARFLARNWVLEGSPDGQKWQMLSEHRNDGSLQAAVRGDAGEEKWTC